MRVRLRPAHGDVALAMMYDKPHEHTCWPDHVERVAATIGMGRELIAKYGRPELIADLSCGDATIARTLGAESAAAGAVRIMLGDLAPGYEFRGPIEQTLREITRADLFICTETIEHLDDPDTVLAMIRGKATSLLLSTPLGEIGPANFQHYWGWDDVDVRLMLKRSGWAPELYREVRCEVGGESWAYQLWGCR